MNSENSKTSDLHKLLLNILEKINLKRIDKYVAVSNLNIYHKKYYKSYKSYKSTKFKISAPTWNKEFELLDGLYSVSDIQDYFEYILKNVKQLLIILQ